VAQRVTVGELWHLDVRVTDLIAPAARFVSILSMAATDEPDCGYVVLRVLPLSQRFCGSTTVYLCFERVRARLVCTSDQAIVLRIRGL
jgi:hypothetical protein